MTPSSCDRRSLSESFEIVPISDEGQPLRAVSRLPTSNDIFSFPNQLLVNNISCIIEASSVPTRQQTALNPKRFTYPTNLKKKIAIPLAIQQSASDKEAHPILKREQKTYENIQIEHISTDQRIDCNIHYYRLTDEPPNKRETEQGQTPHLLRIEYTSKEETIDIFAAYHIVDQTNRLLRRKKTAILFCSAPSLDHSLFLAACFELQAAASQRRVNPETLEPFVKNTIEQMRKRLKEPPPLDTELHRTCNFLCTYGQLLLTRCHKGIFTAAQELQMHIRSRKITKETLELYIKKILEKQLSASENSSICEEGPFFLLFISKNSLLNEANETLQFCPKDSKAIFKKHRRLGEEGEEI